MWIKLWIYPKNCQISRYVVKIFGSICRSHFGGKNLTRYFFFCFEYFFKTPNCHLKSPWKLFFKIVWDSPPLSSWQPHECLSPFPLRQRLKLGSQFVCEFLNFKKKFFSCESAKNSCLKSIGVVLLLNHYFLGIIWKE